MRKFFAAALAVALFSTPILAQDKIKTQDPEEVLAGLLKTVRNTEDVNVRINAFMALAEFGPKAAPAMPFLLESLEVKNEDLRLNAAITLAKIGKQSVKPVAKLLSSDDVDTRYYAIWTIGGIGPDAKETAPLVIKAMSDKDVGIRRKAAYALGRIGAEPKGAMSVLVSAFGDENDDVRQSAGEALAKFGKDAVPSLLELLKADNIKARLQASTSLGDIGSDAKEAVPLLKDLYLAKDAGNNVYHYAQTLAKLGKTAVAALEAGFKDSRAEVRAAASQAMQQMGADAVGVLVDALGDKNVEVRRLAAQTLWPMRIGDKSVVVALAYALSDEDDNVRQTCMNALANLGAMAKPGAAKIKSALTDMNPNVRTQAYYLLQQIGENPNEALKKGLASKEAKVRINTAALMVNVNYDVNSAIPVLVEALKHNDLGLQMQAAFTLAQRRLETEKVVPLFVDGLKHKSSGVRMQAVQGLSMFGNQAQGAAPKLAEALADSDAQVRQQAVYALQNVRGTPDAVVPILFQVYKNAGPDGRRTVMQVAWLYADKGMDIIVDGLKDKDAGVRQQAIFSLQNVRGTPERMVPILSGVYKEGDVNLKRSILSIVHIYGIKAKDIITTGLREKDASIRQQAVFALNSIQGDISEALPTIVALMKEKDSGINRQQFMWLLQRSGEAAVPHLGDLLKDTDVNIRLQAVQILRNFGPKAAKAIPQIKDATKDENSQVRLTAMLALASSGGEGPEYLAGQFKKEKDSGIRANLLQALAYSRDRNLAVPLLVPAMKDPAAQVRHTTISILGAFGRDSAAGFEAFTLGLKDSDNQVRVNAGYLASFYGNKAWESLEDALKSAKDAGFRQAILQSMQNSQYRSKASVNPLIECLKDGNPTVRQFACNVLANIGPDASAALEALKGLTSDGGNPNVQNAARNAISRIEAK